MAQLTHNTVSWIMLVVAGGGYVALLVISSDEAAGPVLATAGLCPLCGYNLKHDFCNGCSECGWERA